MEGDIQAGIVRKRTATEIRRRILRMVQSGVLDMDEDEDYILVDEFPTHLEEINGQLDESSSGIGDSSSGNGSVQSSQNPSSQSSQVPAVLGSQDAEKKEAFSQDSAMDTSDGSLSDPLRKTSG